MDNTALTHRTAIPDARNRAHGGLVEWHSISVVRYADGVTRAWHNHLDLPTRKLVSEQLPDPLGPTPGWPWHVLCLLTAAEELEARHTDDHGL